MKISSQLEGTLQDESILSALGQNIHVISKEVII
jgi:hypothetical protein